MSGMSTDIRTTFSTNVRARLAELGLTQTDLAYRLGCSQPFVSQFLQPGYCPGLVLVSKVAEVLGTTPGKLVE